MLGHCVCRGGVLHGRMCALGVWWGMTVREGGWYQGCACRWDLPQMPPTIYRPQGTAARPEEHFISRSWKSSLCCLDDPSWQQVTVRIQAFHLRVRGSAACPQASARSAGLRLIACTQFMRVRSHAPSTQTPALTIVPRYPSSFQSLAVVTHHTTMMVYVDLFTCLLCISPTRT